MNKFITYDSSLLINFNHQKQRCDNSQVNKIGQLIVPMFWLQKGLDPLCLQKVLDPQKQLFAKIFLNMKTDFYTQFYPHNYGMVVYRDKLSYILLYWRNWKAWYFFFEMAKSGSYPFLQPNSSIMLIYSKSTEKEAFIFFRN